MHTSDWMSARQDWPSQVYLPDIQSDICKIDLHLPFGCKNPRRSYQLWWTTQEVKTSIITKSLVCSPKLIAAYQYLLAILNLIFKTFMLKNGVSVIYPKCRPKFVGNINFDITNMNFGWTLGIQDWTSLLD